MQNIFWTVHRFPNIFFRCLQITALRVAFVKKRRGQASHRQMTEVEDQYREEERKLVEENVNLRQRLDSVQAKLTTLQLDRGPSTPVTQLQEQVNQWKAVWRRFAYKSFRLHSIE